MKALRTAGADQQTIAEAFGVSRQQVSRIIRSEKRRTFEAAFKKLKRVLDEYLKKGYRPSDAFLDLRLRPRCRRLRPLLLRSTS